MSTGRYYQSPYGDQLSNLSSKDVRFSNKSQATSATKILQLIKQKKIELASQIYSSASIKPPSAEKQRVEPKQLVLPRLKSASKDSIGSLDVQPRSVSISHIKLTDGVESEQDLRREKNQSKKVITLGIQQIDELQQLDEIRNTDTFERCLGQVPKQTKLRNIKNMEPIVMLMKQVNPFFKNLPQILISSLFKVCRINNYEKSQKIYHRNDKLVSFYIILWGKVKISDLISDFRKVSVRGQTLCQHILFDPNCPKFRFQTAKALSNTSLLEIPLYLYKKIYEQLVLYGYKSDFTIMENLIKRNFIFKQSLKSHKL